VEVGAAGTGGGGLIIGAGGLKAGMDDSPSSSLSSKAIFLGFLVAIMGFDIKASLLNVY